MLKFVARKNVSKAEKKRLRKEKARQSRNTLSFLKEEFGNAGNEEEIDWSRIYLKVALQAHQSEAVRRIETQRSKWGDFSNGVSLDMFMGKGKTIIALNIIVEFLREHGNSISEAMSSKGIIILCSSSDLRNQWCEEIRTKTNIPPSRVFLWTVTKNFPKVPTDGTPYIVLVTYRILLFANNLDIREPFMKDRWKLIITDEAHSYRNMRTYTSISLLRLVLGKKATAELKKKVGKSSKDLDIELGLDDDDAEHVRKRFTDMFIDCPSEGSPGSFRMFLSGTFLVNTIMDLLIHALIINQVKTECHVHGESHEYNSEDWWRKNLFVLIKDSKKITKEAVERGESIYREFINDFFIHLDEEYIDSLLELPKRSMEEHLVKFVPGSIQQNAYDCVAHAFVSLYETLSGGVSREKKNLEEKSLKQIRSQIVVCIQFLTMLGLHPACVKAELTRGKKEISKYGKLLLEAYSELGLQDMSYKEPSIKTLEIIRIIKELLKNDPSVQIIVFSAFRSFQDILYYHLRKNIPKSNVSRYYGGMSKGKKTQELDKFKTGKSNILLSIFKSGGLGLNLTCATHMIICEPPYTHADWIQAVCRMHRIGQNKPVVVHDIVLSGGIDIWRMSKNSFKYNLQKKFRESPTGILDKDISMQETRDLYDMIITSPATFDETTLDRLEKMQKKILNLHIEKFGEHELLSDDTEKEIEGSDDEFIFEMSDDEIQDAIEMQELEEELKVHKPYKRLLEQPKLSFLPQRNDENASMDSLEHLIPAKRKKTNVKLLTF